MSSTAPTDESGTGRRTVAVTRKPSDSIEDWGETAADLNRLLRLKTTHGPSLVNPRARIRGVGRRRPANRACRYPVSPPYGIQSEARAGHGASYD